MANWIRRRLRGGAIIFVLMIIPSAPAGRPIPAGGRSSGAHLRGPLELPRGVDLGADFGFGRRLRGFSNELIGEIVIDVWYGIS